MAIWFVADCEAHYVNVIPSLINSKYIETCNHLAINYTAC